VRDALPKKTKNKKKSMGHVKALMAEGKVKFSTRGEGGGTAPGEKTGMGFAEVTKKAKWIYLKEFHSGNRLEGTIPQTSLWGGSRSHQNH